MKRRHLSLLLTVATVVCANQSHAVDLINDTWLDGTRTDPASPAYSENGVDSDLDGNLESAWYFGGAGSFAPVGAGGPLRGDLGAGGTGSGSWTTYFTAGGAPINLTTAGDSIKVTWQFTLSGLGAANTSQNFRLALVNTPTADLLTGDAAPGSSAYAGYGMFMNMGATTLGNSNPFRLMERTDPVTASALLSASASWAGLANGATSGNGGYEESVLYTYLMEIVLNSAGELDITSSMTGGTLLNNTGSASVSFTDTTPNSTSFNTFSIRPSSATGTAQIFDTSLFRLEVVQSPVPEPTVVVLAGLGILSLIASRRARR